MLTVCKVKGIEVVTVPQKTDQELVSQATPSNNLEGVVCETNQEQGKEKGS